ncbi:hypothetical protein vBSlqSZDD2_32 [Serratia phage vB_SlqS_ZDD2]|nr:hypothetical protein vBSlqSZDD2_32 [Serratia phage vB_SlqS_ZDD2]
MAVNLVFIRIPDRHEPNVSRLVNPFFITRIAPEAFKPRPSESNPNPELEAYTTIYTGPGDSVETNLTVTQIENLLFKSGKAWPFVRVKPESYYMDPEKNEPEEIEHYKQGVSVNVDMVASMRDMEGNGNDNEIQFGTADMIYTQTTSDEFYKKVEAIQGYARQAMIEDVQGVIVQSIQTGGAIYRAMKK